MALSKLIRLVLLVCIWRSQTVRGTPGGRVTSLTSLGRQPKCGMIFQRATRDPIAQLSRFYFYNTSPYFAVAITQLPPSSTSTRYRITIQKSAREYTTLIF